MSQNTSISLGNHYVKFASEQVAQGRYNTVSDVVRSGLRLLEEKEAKLVALRQALIEGEQSGAAEPFDFAEFVKQKKSAS